MQRAFCCVKVCTVRTSSLQSICWAAALAQRGVLRLDKLQCSARVNKRQCDTAYVWEAWAVCLPSLHPPPGRSAVQQVCSCLVILWLHLTKQEDACGNCCLCTAGWCDLLGSAQRPWGRRQPGHA